MNGRIGITLGDVTGIGPEVTLKAMAAWPDEGHRCLVIGDEGCLRATQARLGLSLDLKPFRNWEQPGRFFFHDPSGSALPAKLSHGDPAVADAALEWLREGTTLCLTGQLDGLVTAPVNKESILRLGQPFVGQTEYIAGLAAAKRTAMMLLGHDPQGRWLRVALATTHLRLGAVAAALDEDKVRQAIDLAVEACGLLKLPSARIGVCGLNPHAGEGGELGTEEMTIIGPAVRAARSRRLDVRGPFAADTLFYHAYLGEYDAVVAMYHDQGLVPLKMVAFENGVNWTLGLPFVRTSPDHGTAYNLFGQGNANPSSMIAAIRLCCQLVGASPARVPISGISTLN